MFSLKKEICFWDKVFYVVLFSLLLDLWLIMMHGENSQKSMSPFRCKISLLKSMIVPDLLYE